MVKLVSSFLFTYLIVAILLAMYQFFFIFASVAGEKSGKL
nr:MAG TPA: hypothetical protein [Caudoviricetes sp.]